jgi:molybdopterin/thiamine biosynthesis adenylyltransferase
MSRRRWWQAGIRSIEAEAAWFAQDGLEFELDEQVLREREVVVFRGHLRLGEKRSEAMVVYPASYGAGGQAAVIAPGLPLGRHISPDGTLCLDHPTLGRLEPMIGAEAVARAEHLWDLWENDRDGLAREEADTPDARANYYTYAEGSVVLAGDADLAGHTQGYVHLNATGLGPLRAHVTKLRATHPAAATIPLAPSSDFFGGSIEVVGAWKRVPDHPPERPDRLVAWLHEYHEPFVQAQISYARQTGQAERRPDLPAVCAFVYPDEGPDRGQSHDAWLYVAFHPGGELGVARSLSLREDERWIRQPQMRPLADSTVAVLGVGALGSQLADQLAKSGVGRLILLDHDVLSVGNRVRHQLDMADVGRGKAAALADRMRRVDPWIQIDVLPFQLGIASGDVQAVDDRVIAALETCETLVNATARSVTGSYISLIANELDMPAIHAWVTAGAWGARLLRQRPGHSACWDCFAFSEERPPTGVEVPRLAHDPHGGEVTERGCADPTFTGPGFELAAAAAACARLTVQTLLDDADRYPLADYDLVSIQFRDETSARTTTQYTDLPIHPDCELCAGRGTA